MTNRPKQPPQNQLPKAVPPASGKGQDIMPWVSAEELQPAQRPQSSAPLDDVDEALLESFPCSDPPCSSHAHV